MKKALLGTTALVGASLLLAGPAAAEKVPLVPGAAVQPLFPMTLGLGGWANWEAILHDQDFSQSRGQGHDFLVEDPVLNISWRGRADNGLEYYADFKIHARNIAEVDPYLGFTGSWGTLELGNQKGPSQSMAVGAENIVAGSGNWGYETGENLSDYEEVWNMPKTLLGRNYQNIVLLPSSGPLGPQRTLQILIDHSGLQGAEAVGFNPYEPRLFGDSKVSTKAVYFTPRIAGAQVGISYAPKEQGSDVNFVEGTTSRGLDREYVSRDDNGVNQEIWEAGVNYQKSIRGVDFTAAWVGLHGQAEAASYGGQFTNPLAQFKPDRGTDLRDINSWAAGGSLAWRGFSLAGEYGDNGTSGMAEDLSHVTAISNSGGATLNRAGVTTPGEVSGDAGWWWNLGGAYEFGATEVSLSYFHGEQEIDTCGMTAGAIDQNYDSLMLNTATCATISLNALRMIPSLATAAGNGSPLSGLARRATLDMFTVGATHRLAEGLIVYGNVDFIDFNYPGPLGGIIENRPAGFTTTANAAGARDFDNDGVAIILGTAVNF